MDGYQSCGIFGNTGMKYALIGKLLIIKNIHAYQQDYQRYVARIYIQISKRGQTRAISAKTRKEPQLNHNTYSRIFALLGDDRNQSILFGAAAVIVGYSPSPLLLTTFYTRPSKPHSKFLFAKANTVETHDTLHNNLLVMPPEYKMKLFRGQIAVHWKEELARADIRTPQQGTCILMQTRQRPLSRKFNHLA